MVHRLTIFDCLRVPGWGRKSRCPLLAIALSMLAGPIAGSAAEDPVARVITVPNQGFEGGYWNEYFLGVLTQALDRTVASCGPYQILTSRLVMSHQDRALRSVSQGELVDVAWAMTNARRERDMLPVRIPLTRGLLGFRLLVIRERDLPRFAGVRGQNELRDFVAGQGLDWPDTDILRANQLPVMAGRDSRGLYGMLQRGRFDYFPRGMMEVWPELEGGMGGTDVVVEPNLLIHYPAAVYFFVNRHATELARRIEVGLRSSMADGSFMNLFDETHREAIALSRLPSRRIVRLENPLLPPETPLDETALWFDGGHEQGP